MDSPRWTEPDAERGRPRSDVFQTLLTIIRCLLLLSVPAVAGIAEGNGGNADRRASAVLPPEVETLFTVPDPDRKLPFSAGERLTFLIGWSIFDVGEAVLTVDEAEVDGEEAFLFTLKVRTNSFADRIYRVRNHTQSWVDRKVMTTLHYHNDQNEGSRERDITYDFEWEGAAGTVRYRNRTDRENPGFREPVEVIRGTFDPMGITFFIRTLDYKVGDRIYVPTTNGRERMVAEVDVVERVERRFRLGRQSAIVLRPDIEDVGGVFRRSDNATVTFYMSDDDRRLPLRMESSVTVGSFWAELVKVERPGEETEDALSDSTLRRRGR